MAGTWGVGWGGVVPDLADENIDDPEAKPIELKMKVKESINSESFQNVLHASGFRVSMLALFVL